MSGLDASKSALLKGLFASVSDEVLERLGAALNRGADDDAAVFQASRQAQDERRDRDVRDVVFAPLAPLCRPAAREGIDPAAAARLSCDPVPELWRLLRRGEPQAVEAAVAAVTDPDQRHLAGPRSDALLRIAAERLPEDSEWEGVRVRSEAGPTVSPGRLALVLRLAPTLREMLPRAREIARAASPEHAAALRLAFRDAEGVVPGSAPTLLAALSAHMPQPWQVLRLVSAVMERPTERFLAVSELAPFGENVLADIDARIARLGAFRGDTGAEGGAAAAAAVLACAFELSEFDAMITLSPDGPWGRRVARQRVELAQTVSRRLKEAAHALAQALPTGSPKLGGRVRGAPDLDGPFDAPAAQRAQGLLAFLDGTRSSAGHGGFGAVRAAVVAELDTRLDVYVDDLLAELHARGGGEGADGLRERLAFAADCLGFVRDAQSAQIVRRRAAAA